MTERPEDVLGSDKAFVVRLFRVLYGIALVPACFGAVFTPLCFDPGFTADTIEVCYTMLLSPLALVAGIVLPRRFITHGRPRIGFALAFVPIVYAFVFPLLIRAFLSAFDLP